MECSRNSNLGFDDKCTCSFTECEKLGKSCSCVLNQKTIGGITGFFIPKM
jgi:hypothetical protein